MYDILSVFSVLYPHLSTTPVRQVFSRGLGLACDDGACVNAEPIALDFRRGELPHNTTLFQHRYALGDCLLGVF